jgi:energy-coupling factor transporter ATP-binding protein EcfA2
MFKKNNRNFPVTMEKPTFVFLSGTSAVGKSTLMNLISDRYDNITTVPMAARTQRERLGNPSWETLCNDVALADKHQEFIFNAYGNIILGVAHHVDNLMEIRGPHSNIFIFERSPVDVGGYAEAFGCSYALPMKLMNRLKFIESMLDEPHLGIKCVHNHMAVDKKIPYVQTEARPTEEIRNKCASFVEVVLTVRNDFTHFNNYSSDSETALTNLITNLKRF